MGRLSRTKGDNCLNDYRTFVLTCEHYIWRPCFWIYVIEWRQTHGIVYNRTHVFTLFIRHRYTIVMIHWCTIHCVLLDSLLYIHLCNFAPVTQLAADECIWNKQLMVGLWCLTPLSKIYQLYRGCQFYLVEKTGENHRPVAIHWQILSHNIVSSTPRHERGSKSQL